MNTRRTSLGQLAISSPRSRERFSATSQARHTDVVMTRNQSLLSMDPSQDPSNRVHTEGLYLEQTATTNEIITVDWYYCAAQTWNPVDHFLLQHSSVLKPNFVYERKASNERRFTLNECVPGTKYFFVVSAIDSYGKVIIRSPNLTAQTSAPIDRPVLRLKKALPDVISLEWDEPPVYGDGHICEYHLYVNGKYYTTLSKTKRCYDYIQCASLQQFTFRLQAISLRHECNSESSNVIDVTCPAVLPITLTRMRPKSINTVQVSWNLPTCVGFAKVKEFKVYYKEVSKDRNYNDQEIPDPDKIIGHRHAKMRSYKPNQTMSTIPVEPDKRYWAILTADVLPEGVPPVTSLAIRVRATIRPCAPVIKVTIYGQQERCEINRKITVLLAKRDKINRRKDLFRSSDVVNGAELKNDEVKNMNVMLYEMEQELQELIRIVNKFTGFVPVVIDWQTPKFDEFSEPESYQINVDDHSYEEPLSLDSTQHSLKLDVEKDSHSVSLTTLSWHPVGHSDPSNEETVPAKEFRPNRFFCYFTSHKKNISWPGKGACRLEDCLAHESKLTSKTNVHRGLLKTRDTPKPFRVMGVHDATWQSLIRHFGAKKPTIILFWTKWCISSHNALEKLSSFAQKMKDKYLYLACCVKSGEDQLTHRKSVIELLNRKNLRNVGKIRHCCACHPAPDLPNNTVEKMQNASIPSSFDLNGVPTFVMLDSGGQMAWQGRVAADTNDAFFTYMSHVMSQVQEHACVNMECKHCADEKEMTYEREEHEKKLGEKQDGGGEPQDGGLKFTLDEFHLLHSKVHGKALGDAEKTEDESYTKLSSLSSPRKSWRERRLANRGGLQKGEHDDKPQVRFVDVTGEQPRGQHLTANEELYAIGDDKQLRKMSETNDSDHTAGCPDIGQKKHGVSIYNHGNNHHGNNHHVNNHHDNNHHVNNHHDNNHHGNKLHGNNHHGNNHHDNNHHKNKDHQKMGVRFSTNQPSCKGDFRSYQHRDPTRSYRSPNAAYDKGRFGYGAAPPPASRGTTQPRAAIDSPQPEPQQDSSAENKAPGYRYSSINYHASRMISDDHLDDDGGVQPSKNISNTNLAYQKNSGVRSAINAYSVSRDSSRGSGLSSTWPRSKFDDVDDHEFMKPIAFRNKENYGNTGTNEGHQVRKEYIYEKPSHVTRLDDVKSARSRRKYGHIRSSYAQGVYKPLQGAQSPLAAVNAPLKRSVTSLSARGLKGHAGTRRRSAHAGTRRRSAPKGY